MGVDARDIDNDGREDLFVTANNNETFPRNLGKGLFADTTYPSSLGRLSLSYAGWSNGICRPCLRVECVEKSDARITAASRASRTPAAAIARGND
jgi:hypothetical protein